MKTNPQYQAHDWLDTKANKPKHGIDALVSGRWMHCAENGKPLLYDTEEERDAKLRKLRRAAGRKSSASKPRHSPSAEVSHGSAEKKL